MATLITLATASVLGFVHALDVDHMLAVTAFVSRRPAVRTAARFGFRWGIGHSVAVLVIGGVLLASGLRWSERYDRIAEAAVGMMLIAIGAWSLRSTRNLHIHLPAEHGDHAHLHTHPAGGAEHRHSHPHEGPSPPDHSAELPRPHAHPQVAAAVQNPGSDRRLTLIGLIHGLAGTSGAVALVPVTLVERPTTGLAYLLAFGVGVTLAMTLFAALTAIAIRRASARSLLWGRRISTVIASAGILLGLWWLWSALASGA